MNPQRAKHFCPQIEDNEMGVICVLCVYVGIGVSVHMSLMYVCVCVLCVYYVCVYVYNYVYVCVLVYHVKLPVLHLDTSRYSPEQQHH